MFIKRKNRAGKTYACRMLLSIKTDVVCINPSFLTSQKTTVSVVKQLSLGITRFFAGNCPMSGANIQGCVVEVLRTTKANYHTTCFRKTAKVLVMRVINQRTKIFNINLVIILLHSFIQLSPIDKYILLCSSIFSFLFLLTL